MEILKSAALVIILTCLSLSAQALTIWTLTDVMFEDGGMATGSFSFDAGSNTYSDIMLATTAASSFPDTDYSAFQAGNATTLQVANGLSVLQLAFVDALTDLGGTVALGSNSDGRSPFEGICNGSVPCRDYTSMRNIVLGSVTTEVAALAEPGSLSLLLISLAGIAGFRRRNIT